MYNRICSSLDLGKQPTLSRADHPRTITSPIAAVADHPPPPPSRGTPGSRYISLSPTNKHRATNYWCGQCRLVPSLVLVLSPSPDRRQQKHSALDSGQSQGGGGTVRGGGSSCSGLGGTGTGRGSEHGCVVSGHLVSGTMSGTVWNGVWDVVWGAVLAYVWTGY